MAETTALEFKDIEPPLPPGTDWQAWLENGLWVLLAMLVLWLLWRLGRRWLSPLWHGWRLRQLSRRIRETSADESGLRRWLWQLYGWSRRLDTKELSEAEGGFHPFKKQLQAAAFSSQTVSRETCLELEAQAQEIWKAWRHQQGVQQIILWRRRLLSFGLNRAEGRDD